ncbi:hypothetical protein FHS01_000001 [Longimicrobium terrae]|uniref:Uncharacterized protein n=1 Tax=Longimicrobium terrae TaxID=1639882 RepID=A0A841GVX7_9BACT|nr:hypothetical protein [Longimicrobium terrae]MBB4633995.1 hypothetical protein [Longimicrobium terrae]MBB6069115.1 hypothetical protein [Longimicrobium terrae]
MNSPLEMHEVRLRGLHPRLWRIAIKRRLGRTSPAARCVAISSGATAIQERMNSPLEEHEVRLRGLCRRVGCAGRSWLIAR